MAHASVFSCKYKLVGRVGLTKTFWCSIVFPVIQLKTNDLCSYIFFFWLYDFFLFVLTRVPRKKMKASSDLSTKRAKTDSALKRQADVYIIPYNFLCLASIMLRC